jgi:RNA polymerase sigma-70 factor (ECF subfamily)
MPENDKYYIEHCLNGQPDEFRHLVRGYQAGLMAYLAGKLGNRDIAEEAAQETFVRAYFGLSKLKKHDCFHSWLLGIANHVAQEHLRNRQKTAGADYLEDKFTQENAAVDYELEQAIAELPESYREAILLRFYGGLSCSQIADKLNMPIGTVTTTLSRAYEKLRLLLEKQKKQ